MNWISAAFAWIADPTNHTGSQSIAALTIEHLWITGLATLISLIVGVPLGYAIGHTGKGRQLVVGLSGAARALPAIGLLTLVGLLAGIGLLAPMVALVVLAVPSVIAGAYSGIDSIEPSTIDAAYAMGYSPAQVLFRVEIPLGMPQLLGGIRNAVLQVIATATLASYVGAGGLGVLLFRGLKTSDYAQMLASAILIMALALVLDLIFEIITRMVNRVVSPGR